MLVAQIEWITIERSAFPKRKGMHDFGLIDLPFPMRRMSLSPLGMLRQSGKSATTLKFERGADALPSLGTSVLLPTDTQLRSIVESGENRRIKIGVSPLASNAEVRVDPDRLFGRHLAVLGNTGSGKSCTVAGLIRWSLEEARKASGKTPNARFVILDPNGEYASAFEADSKAFGVKCFCVKPEGAQQLLRTPLWFWNSAEWCSFTQASSKSQRPLIKRALREVKAGRDPLAFDSEESVRQSLRRYMSMELITLQREIKAGAIRHDSTKFGQKLTVIYVDLCARSSHCTGVDIENVLTAITSAIENRSAEFNEKGTGKIVKYFKPFEEQEVNAIVRELREVVGRLGGLSIEDGPDEDTPIPFSGAAFVEHLEALAEKEGVSQYVDVLLGRVRTFLSDSRMNGIVGESDDVSLIKWLQDVLGDSENPGGITILDLSLVPTEVVHIVTSVIARIVFESLQRYRKVNGASLPTVLVAEEAHTFIKRYKEDVENADAASICCQVFERIAREGRKFGLGLLLSSQRPAELSSTVLSQCNSFLLHRINNDRDQELVARLLPDNLKGLLKELPTLASRNAILLGWAAELPVLVRINELAKNKIPKSHDPDFWNVWTGKDENGTQVDRPTNWQPIVDDWIGE